MAAATAPRTSAGTSADVNNCSSIFCIDGSIAALQVDCARPRRSQLVESGREPVVDATRDLLVIEIASDSMAIGRFVLHITLVLDTRHRWIQRKPRRVEGIEWDDVAIVHGVEPPLDAAGTAHGCGEPLHGLADLGDGKRGPESDQEHAVPSPEMALLPQEVVRDDSSHRCRHNNRSTLR